MLGGFSISVYLKSKAGKRKPEDSKVPHSRLRGGEGEEATGQVREKEESGTKAPCMWGIVEVINGSQTVAPSEVLTCCCHQFVGDIGFFFCPSLITDAMLFKSAGEKKHSYFFVRTLDICYLTFDIHTQYLAPLKFTIKSYKSSSHFF